MAQYSTFESHLCAMFEDIRRPRLLVCAPCYREIGALVLTSAGFKFSRRGVRMGMLRLPRVLLALIAAWIASCSGSHSTETLKIGIPAPLNGRQRSVWRIHEAGSNARPLLLIRVRQQTREQPARSERMVWLY